MGEGLAMLSRDRMMAHVERFARSAKYAGTPGEMASFRDLATDVAALGFATELVTHPAYISLPGPAALTVSDMQIACITHSFATATPTEGLRAPVVYLRGGMPADFAAQDVTDQIVLVDGIAGPEIAARATAAGAAGQIHISPHEHLHEMCVSSVWGSPSAETLSQLPTTAIVTIAHTDGERLIEQARHGIIEASLHAAVDTGWRPIPLLVAHLDPPGAAGGPPFVLLSGHHDTWHIGAMDNGSANAAMLELARVAVADRARWRRGLRLCFWSGHSQGRYAGSAWYADEHADELAQRCVAHVNVDSLGGRGATIVTQSGTTADLADFAARAVAAETGDRHAGRRLGRSSDMSFMGIGIPAMFGVVSQQPPSTIAMRQALGWWWHTPEDTADKIDPALLLRDTRIVWRALDGLLSADRLPLVPSRTAAALSLELAMLAQRLADRLDMTVLVHNAETCCAAIKAIEARLDRQSPDAADAVLLALSRQLVRLDYVDRDPCAPDPALPQAAWPLLAPLRALANASAGADLNALTISATRARNRVGRVLRNLSAVVAAADLID